MDLIQQGSPVVTPDRLQQNWLGSRFSQEGLVSFLSMDANGQYVWTGLRMPELARALGEANGRPLDNVRRQAVIAEIEGSIRDYGDSNPDLTRVLEAQLTAFRNQNATPVNEANAHPAAITRPTELNAWLRMSGFDEVPMGNGQRSVTVTIDPGFIDSMGNENTHPFAGTVPTTRDFGILSDPAPSNLTSNLSNNNSSAPLLPARSGVFLEPENSASLFSAIGATSSPLPSPGQAPNGLTGLSTSGSSMTDAPLTGLLSSSILGSPENLASMATAFGMTADKLRDLLLDPSTDPLLIQKLLNRWYDLAATTPQEASDEQTTEGNRQPNADSDAAENVDLDATEDLTLDAAADLEDVAAVQVDRVLSFQKFGSSSSD